MQLSLYFVILYINLSQYRKHFLKKTYCKTYHARICNTGIFLLSNFHSLILYTRINTYPRTQSSLTMISDCNPHLLPDQWIVSVWYFFFYYLRWIFECERLIPHIKRNYCMTKAPRIYASFSVRISVSTKDDRNSLDHRRE